MASRPSRRPRLSTAQSPFYQQWVLTNLTAKPFPASYGKRFALNLTEWRILLTVADRPGITASALSDFTGLDKMTVSRVVRALESRGLMDRLDSAEDRRRRHLQLTDEGWAVYQHIAKAARAREAQIYGILSAAEHEQLHRLLVRLADHARDLD